VTASTLSFGCSATLEPPNCASFPGYGNFLVTAGSATTGDFEPYENRPGFVGNLNIAGQPINTPFSLPDWLLLGQDIPGTGDDVSFELTFIFEGNLAPCQLAPGNTNCTPGTEIGLPFVSPYNLTQSGGPNTTASFSVLGLVHSPTGDISNFTGTFSADFAGQTIDDLLADFLADGTIVAPWSADYVSVFTPIPEPGTVVSAIAGLALIAVGAYRRRRA
jgi:hypothetical protein